jgi:hypothetical protein
VGRRRGRRRHRQAVHITCSTGGLARCTLQHADDTLGRWHNRSHNRPKRVNRRPRGYLAADLAEGGLYALRALGDFFIASMASSIVNSATVSTPVSVPAAPDRHGN